MTCTECRDLLPLHLYGDLSDAERANVDDHLTGCGPCRADLAALTQTRAALDAIPVVVPVVDLNRIYRAEIERQRRAARRWRAAALVGVAAALIFAALRLEVRADGRHLSIRWGPEPAIVPPVPPPPVIVRAEPALTPDLDERLNVLTALVHALAANVDAGDRERAEELVRLRQELAGLARQGDQRWTETGRTVSALYTAQFGPRAQGEKR